MDRELAALLQQIKPTDTRAVAALRERLRRHCPQTDPKLAALAAQLGGILKDRSRTSLKKAVLIFAADHAVDGKENKTHGRQSKAAAEKIAAGCGPINQVAHRVGAGVLLLEMGLEDPVPESPGVQDLQVMKGARFWEKGAAMTADEMLDALFSGVQLADTLAAEGYDVLGIGQLGERAFVTALVMTAVYCRTDLSPRIQDCTDAETRHLLTGIAQKRLSPATPLDVLQQAGAPDIAAMTGFILGAAYHERCVFFDTAVTGAAVLTAQALCPATAQYVFPSEHYDEPVHRMQMQKLGQTPFLETGHLDGQGTGAALGLALADAAQQVLGRLQAK